MQGPELGHVDHLDDHAHLLLDIPGRPAMVQVAQDVLVDHLGDGDESLHAKASPSKWLVLIYILLDSVCVAKRRVSHDEVRLATGREMVEDQSE